MTSLWRNRRGWTDLDALDRSTGTLVYGLGRSVDLERMEDGISSSRSAPSYTDSLFVVSKLTKVGASSGVTFFSVASAIFMFEVECTAASAGLPPDIKR
jgi:hypothetical protein